MRGSVKRSTPLRRYTRLRPIGKTAHARRERDFKYMDQVRRLPCVATWLYSGADGCEGRIEANHVGGRFGKDADRNTIPMCHKHHEDWTGRVGGGGIFAHWTPAMRRGWGSIVVALVAAEIARRGRQ